MALENLKRLSIGLQKGHKWLCIALQKGHLKRLSIGSEADQCRIYCRNSAAHSRAVPVESSAEHHSDLEQHLPSSSSRHTPCPCLQKHTNAEYLLQKQSSAFQCRPVQTTCQTWNKIYLHPAPFLLSKTTTFFSLAVGNIP